ncbi:hypothetical protein [Methylobacterium sp. 1973]|uniref:glycine-rich domain-containing protein n=1 Tax=Methylobacterium sp. 1973 TaxID=3156421 RepID=UPI003397B3DB
MATNGFLPNSTGVGATVLSDAAYAASSSLALGAQVGVLPPEYYNKVNRQSTVIASMIGQFIVLRAGVDANDSQSISTLEANFEAALAAYVNTIVGSTQGPPHNIAPFFTNGSYTWTCPTGLTRVFAQVWGAGGGGSGGGNSAGSGGGYSAGWFTVTPGTSYTIIVGAGGPGNSGTSTGGNGGTSSFASFCSATGGLGGSAGPQTGGNGSGGQINLQGGRGEDIESANYYAMGGMAPFGGVGFYQGAMSPGGGGSATAASAVIGASGSNGADGAVLLSF